ncbi:MAG TPA: TRAP transporter fused permease subunit [Candidatus Binatia bacterium]|jgi:TRAP transporter 4TM/12TM fusion protein|nr:TRAP transporter fused permease subunit [Candidatus Binatia bacterium]
MSDELAASPGRFRALTGSPASMLRVLLISLSVLGSIWALEVHNYFEIAFFKQQYLALFLALALGSVFIAVKAYPKQPGDSVPWYDWLLALGGLAVGLYVTILYPTIAYRLGILSPDRWIFGGLALILIVEATRRVAGGTLAWLALGVILYTRFAEWLPGIFYAKSASWARIASYLYLDSNGMLGLPIDVAAGVVVAFILFGQALYAVGGDKFLTDLALIATGRYRGGPAKVSVVSSALFGTVSGSAVANVVVDGAITIPLMKSTGFPAHLAAAIEAVASNGGQITPPVMGAAAFLMAEFLNIPYGQIALAAAIPATLYYLALFTQIDLEAAKRGLLGLPAEQIPKFRNVIRLGWVFLIPLATLIYTLMIENWEPGKSGMVAVILVFIVGAIQKETRPSFQKIVNAFEETGKILLDIAVITALAGIVIGALHLSGFTFKISLLLVTLSGNNVFLLLLITALGCLFLGLPLPTTVVYITLAVLAAPALVQLGIPPLAAHLFLFYFGMVSLITPPDCLPVYIAASIARANFWQTGWTAMRLGIAAYIVPFIFALHPPLIFIGTAKEILIAIFTAVAGVVLLGTGCAGYLFRPLGWTKRGLLWLAALLLLLPAWSEAWLIADFAGFALGAAIIAWEWTVSADECIIKENET